jgi:hypothetical protein
MPLTRFLMDTSFGPDEIAVLVSAYEAAMRELNIPGPTASGAEILAMTIIRFAKQGSVIPYDCESAPSALCQGYRRKRQALRKSGLQRRSSCRNATKPLGPGPE